MESLEPDPPHVARTGARAPSQPFLPWDDASRRRAMERPMPAITRNERQRTEISSACNADAKTAIPTAIERLEKALSNLDQISSFDVTPIRLRLQSELTLLAVEQDFKRRTVSRHRTSIATAASNR